jgi:hypothetical protein
VRPSLIVIEAGFPEEAFFWIARELAYFLPHRVGPTYTFKVKKFLGHDAARQRCAEA